MKNNKNYKFKINLTYLTYKIMISKRNIIILWWWLLLIVLIFIGGIYFYNRNIIKNERIDNRDEQCIWKIIDSIEYNIDEKNCFETKISSCQKPTYKSINECEEKNWLKLPIWIIND